MAAPAPLFSSKRERRLWLWTVAVVVAIYSTLGPATTVAAALRERNLLRVSIGLALVLVLGPVLWRWLRQRPGWREVGAAMGVAFAYWMVWIRVGSWEERTHLIEYGVVAALIHMALLERDDNGRPVSMPAALAVGATAVLGLLDEGIQALLPNRVFDIRDVFFNALAGFMIVAARLAIAPQRRPGWRVWFLMLWAGAFGWGQGVYLGWFDNTEPKTLETVPADIWSGYLGLVVGATLIGVLQWLVLRRHVSRAGWWVVSSLGAVAVVGLVIFGLGAFDPDVGWFLGVGLFGMAAGMLQWVILRGQLPRAAWWIVASAVGWILGMPLGDVNGPPALGAVYGLATGTALVWLLRSDQTEPARSVQDLPSG